MRLRTTIRYLAFLPCFASRLARSLELVHVWDADVYTVSGYDNLDGHDPICWLAPAFDGHEQPSDSSAAESNNMGGQRILASSDLDIKHDVGAYDFDKGIFTGKVWENPLVPDFVAGHTRTLPSCPKGLDLKISAPQEHRDGEVLRINTPYKFEVDGVIHMDEVRAEYGLSDDAFLYSSSGVPQIAVQILFCPTAGEFCTPFVFSKIKAQVEEEGGEGDASSEELIPVESKLVLLDFPNTTEKHIKVHFEKEVTVSRPDTYIPLGHFEIFLTNGTKNGEEPTDDDVVLKLDVGRELYEGLLKFRSPPKINSVHLGVEIFSYVLIFISGLFLAAMIAFGVKHRQHSVMKLSQGSIMIACVGSALVSTVSSFLFNPKNDAYCKAYGPLIMIPLQAMLAILIARLYRIICVVSPILSWQNGQNRRGRQKERARVRKVLPAWMSKGGSSGQKSSSNSGKSDSASGHSSGEHSGDETTGRRKSSGVRGQRASIRTQFTEKRLWVMVFLITLPQVIAQLVGLIMYPQTLHYVFNDDESEGRVQCINDDFDGMHYIEYALIFLTAFILVFQCQKTKSLPSLFDEAESISAAVFLTIFMLAVGIAVIAVSSEPTSSADVRYLMMVAIVLSLTVNMSCRLLYPKLKLIWCGEEVAVHQMVREHRSKSAQGSSGARASVSSSGYNSEFSSHCSTGENGPSLAGALRRAKFSSAFSDTSTIEVSKVDEKADNTSEPDSQSIVTEASNPCVAMEINSVGVESKEEEVGSHESGSLTSCLKHNNDSSHIVEDSEEKGNNEERIRQHAPIVPDEMAAIKDLARHNDNDSAKLAAVDGPKDDHSEALRNDGAKRKNRRNRVSFCLRHESKEDLKKSGKEAHKSKIIIDQHYVPPKKATLAIMQQNEILHRIHHAVLSGRVVSKEDWEELRENTIEFSTLFQERIQFAWENKETEKA